MVNNTTDAHIVSEAPAQYSHKYYPCDYALKGYRFHNDNYMIVF